MCFSKLAIAEELVVTQVGYVDFRIPADYTSENEELSMDLMAAYDVNGDGYDDLIFGINAVSLSDGWHEENTLVKPVILFWDKSKNRYKPKKRIQMDLPAMYFPRRISGIEVKRQSRCFFC
ncbi:FG-GAP repeat protein [Alphaproteobacteria bacterium]|nr:FG-GAP repeat protein [Alphaproteobacteria bacterium]MDC1121113.1 FG-GAP repeat protein [Alphaproteobacteria bacterium]